MKTRNLLRYFPLLAFLALSGQSVPMPTFRGHAIGGYNPIYIPKRTKLKGWQKENRKYRTNKTK